MSGEMTRQRLQEALGLKHENNFREAYPIPDLRSGLIEMKIPDKPRSSKQRYRLTAAVGLARQVQRGISILNRYEQVYRLHNKETHSACSRS